MQDLPALGDDLPLFLRVAVVAEYVDLWERVERDRMRVDGGRVRQLRAGSRPLDPLRRKKLGRAGNGMILELALELLDGRGACPGDRLVRVDNHPDQPDRIAQGH